MNPSSPEKPKRALPGHRLSILPSLMNDLSAEAKQRLRDTSSVYDVAKGKTLLRTGQFFDGIIVVQSGWLAADIDNVCVSLMPPNSLFLLRLGVAPRAASTNVRVVSANTTIAMLDRDVLETALLESPSTLMTLCDALLRRVRQGFEHTASIALHPLEHRLATFLWEYGHPIVDGARRAPSGVPQLDLASYLGASREELSRKRQLLIRAGYLHKIDDYWEMASAPVA